MTMPARSGVVGIVSNRIRDLSPAVQVRREDVALADAVEIRPARRRL
jgi:hypothetical protein